MPFPAAPSGGRIPLAALSSAADLVCVVDASGTVTWRSAAPGQRWAAGFVVGAHVAAALDAGEAARLRRALASPGRSRIALTLGAGLGGGRIEATVGPEGLERVVHFDETEDDRLDAGLAGLSLRDPLTGLPHRHLFSDRVAHALESRRRDGRLCAVVLVDLVRPPAGSLPRRHPGEPAVVAAAGVLERALRPGDTLARCGSARFGVLLERVDSPRDADRVASRLLDAMRESHDAALAGVVSAGGVAVTEDGRETVRDLLEAAEASAATVGTGSDTGWARQPGARSGRRAADVRGELAGAAERGEMHVYFLPTVDLATGRVVAAEALLRWDHPRRGLLHPGEFLPAAENSPLIVQLGEWALWRACRQAAPWASRGVTLSVNVAGAQLDPGLTPLLLKACSASGLPPEGLTLEVDAGALTEPSAQEALRQARDHGISVCLEDVTGANASVAWLAGLPADELKVDRAFVRRAGEAVPGGDESAGVLVAAARRAGLRPTAEGIETPRQREILAAMGVTRGQGHLFGRAVPASVITADLDRAAR